MIAFVPMAALALTSTRGWIHRMGRNWQRLPRSVYVIAALSVWHFWMVRAGQHDFFEPYVYAALLAVLLLIRLAFFARPRRSSCLLRATPSTWQAFPCRG